MKHFHTKHVAAIIQVISETEEKEDQVLSIRNGIYPWCDAGVVDDCVKKREAGPSTPPGIRIGDKIHLPFRVAVQASILAKTT